jgi:hypothetical protein
MNDYENLDNGKLSPMGVTNIILNWYKILRISRSDREYITDLQQKRLLTNLFN